MPTSDKNVFDDQYLVRYLLGALSAEEAERLDELAISNDDFAWRLRGVENDLVDAYVRSELSGETLRQFDSFYLSSARRRQNVKFAEGLRRFQAAVAAENEPASRASAAGSFSWRAFAAPGLALRFGAAAIAFVMLLVAGYLLFANARLRREVNDARAWHGSIDQRTRELARELSEQRAANAETQKKLELARKAAPDFAELKTVSLLLPPPTRGLTPLKTVVVHRDTDLLVLLLKLESADFSRYRITLKDPATNTVIWRSSELEPFSADEKEDKKAVSVSFRADLMKQQNYTAEVTGLTRGSAAQIVGDYSFHVVLR